ncbi:MAG: chorismate synthase [Anaerolineales bacterium]|nr:chorismate synthase [Anaerolineales bacterium]MDW8445851.1 chorismate synthase [Anaerolineales bacterium]
MSLRFLTAGESHGPALVAILEGIPAGLPLDLEFINRELKRRQVGYGAGPRMKLEEDRAVFLSGIMEGKTIGAPLAILIENLDHSRWKGKAIEAMTIPRPGHADLTATLKYGYRDLRPALERASARETAARVAVGAVCKLYLRQFDIRVEGYVCSIAEIEAQVGDLPLEKRFELSERSPLRCPDESAAQAMQERIRRAMVEKETLGGVLEVIVFGAPPGLGSHVQWDRRLEARLGAALLSIQAIKGVEIGPAFANTRLSGTQAQDGIFLEEKRLVRRTHRSGGIEGGISTGEPILVRAAMKPIATTLTPQPSVDLLKGEETFTRYERSDFCPVPRAVPILEAMVAYVIADALIEKLGGDSLQEQLQRFAQLPKMTLDHFSLEGSKHLFWE